jgi:hypothetical protein
MRNRIIEDVDDAALLRAAQSLGERTWTKRLAKGQFSENNREQRI